jgi:hypothetical protein
MPEPIFTRQTHDKEKIVELEVLSSLHIPFYRRGQDTRLELLHELVGLLR